MKYRKKSYEKQFSPPPILFLISDPSPPPSIYQFYESSCTNSRPFPPRRIHPSRASCMLRQLYLPFVAPFRCQENGMIKDGEIKSRRRTYSTRSKQCIQQFLSARSFHEIPLSSPYLSSIWFVPGLVETSFTVQDSKMHSPSWPISFLPSRGSLSLSNFHSMPYFFEGRGEVISAIPLHILIKPFPSLIDLPRATDRKMVFR